MQPLESPVLTSSMSTSDAIRKAMDVPASEDDSYYVLNSDKRVFEAWASVEVKDSRGEVVPMSDLKRSMLDYMARGAPISLMHTNLIVGKVINYRFMEHPRTKEEGCLITGMIYDDNSVDKATWQGIQTKRYKGVSVGGTALANKNKDGVLRGFEIFEIAIADRPANPEARFDTISAVAKNDTVPVQKPFSGFVDFDACVRTIEGKGYPEESARRICGYLQAQHEKIEKGDFLADEVTTKADPPKEDKPKEEKPADKPAMEKKEDPPKEAPKEPPKDAPPKEEPPKDAPPAAPAPPAEAPKEPKAINDELSDRMEMKAMLVKIYEMLSAAQGPKLTGMSAAPLPAPAAVTEAPVQKVGEPATTSPIPAGVEAVTKSAHEVATPRPEVTSQTAQFDATQAPKSAGDEAVDIALGKSKYDAKKDLRARKN